MAEFISFIKFLYWLATVGLYAGPVIIILIFLFLNPDKFTHWAAIFYRVFFNISTTFPKIWQKVDRYAVAADVEDAVNGICQRINKEAPDAFPHALKIEWTKSENPESFVKKGQVIVRMKHYENQDRNIVDSTLFYLKKGFLPRSRNYLDNTLRNSCEFKVATHIFLAKRDTGAYDYFLENELYPSMTSDTNLKQDIQLLEDLDSVGYFSRVFLTEVKLTGEKLLGTIPTTTIQKELRNFAIFLQTIAKKGDKEYVPLSYQGLKVKAAVVLVARKETIQSYGIGPYVNRISRLVKEGYDSIYVTGWGEDFIKKIVDIKKEVEVDFITVLRRYDYQIRGQVKGILFVCQSNLSHIARQRELQEEVKLAMAEIIPEIKDGEIEIVSIARIRGVGCKVAVRPLNGDIYNALNMCFGENNERFEQLKLKLPNEFLAIVPWSEDIKKFIICALTPLKERYVNSIEIDEENLVANIEVLTDEAYSKAIGKNGLNLKLAKDLTGWLINIKGANKSEIMLTPEQELEEIIRTNVPEIKNDEVEVVRIARIEGLGSKIIVKWKNNSAKRHLASKACLGHNHEYLKAMQQIIGEWLFFHEWSDDPRELIIACLHPIKESDISSMDLNHEEKTVTIKITEQFSHKPYNLSLAEKVTGWQIQII